MEDLIKDIEELQETHKISLYPLRQITTGNNAKSIYQSKEILNDFWTKKNIRFGTEYLSNLIKNKGICGFAIATGYENNIVVIDYDNKETTDKDFLTLLNDCDTLTIETPSKGYHFIFRFNDLLKKNARGIFGNVDIRSNRGLIFSGIREDGRYKIIKNSPVRKMNDDIIHKILSNVNKSNIDPKTTTTAKNKTKEIIKKYDISNEEIRHLLELLPDLYSDKYNEWFIITCILWKQDKKEIWNEWSKKSKKYNEKKNNEIWENMIENEEYMNDLTYLIWLVKYHNKDVSIRNIERVYEDYKPTNEEHLKQAKHINKDFLSKEDIYNDYSKINLIQSGTGTAKTKSTIDFTKEEQEKNNNLKIISITHLKTIADDQYKRFNDAKINIDHYKYLNEMFYDLEDKSGLVIVINSIPRLSNIDLGEYIIYLDEITALIDTIINSPTLKNRKEIINVFIKLLKNAQIIIGTDGIINDLCLSFLSQVMPTEKIRFIINTYMNCQNKYAVFIEDYKDIENKIIENLTNNKPFICCFNTKKHADRIEALIIRINPSFIEKILKYTSTHGAEIKDIKEEWGEEKIILFSPSIVQGVDYNPITPKDVFCFVYGEKTINPVQTSQQIARNRNPLNTYIYIEGCKNKRTFKNGYNEIKKYYKEIDHNNNTVFKDFLDTKSTFEGIEYIENGFTDLFYRYKYDDDVLRSSFKYHLKEILRNKGYEIINDLIYRKIEIDKKEEQKKNNEITEYIKNNKNHQYEKYLNNELSSTDKYKQDLDKKIEILGLNENDVEILNEYKEILTDNERFSIFYNIIYYLCKNNKSNNIKITNRNIDDYSFHTIKEPQTIISTYKKLLTKYTPEINPYYFSYDESKMKNENIKMTDEEFKMIKHITRTTREKPNNKIEFLRFMYFLAKKIFGNNIYKKNFQKRDGKIHKNYSIIYFNEKYFYKCLKHIMLYMKNYNKCPYIEKLIKNEDFINISKEQQGEMNEDILETESIKSFNSEDNIKMFLPYDKIDISLIKEDLI